jgi:predicted GIY-YIG superfamily endonuclease
VTGTRSYWYGRNVVYRCYADDGRLVYVGKSCDVAARLATHRRESWWWPLVGRTRLTVHASPRAAHDAEQQAIREEAPAFNVRRAGASDVLTREHWTDADRELAEQHRRRVLKAAGIRP